MQQGLQFQNSFIVQRSWEKANPQGTHTVTHAQAQVFLETLLQQHAMLGASVYSAETLENIQNNIHDFLIKYYRERKLQNGGKELPTLFPVDAQLTLPQCLEVWRWLNQDQHHAATLQSSRSQPIDLMKPGQPLKTESDGSTRRKLFRELTLFEQQEVLKKSLEMVGLYAGQLRIVYKHYARFANQNVHNKLSTFDSAPAVLQLLSLNRFMLFCRDFELTKAIEYKRRVERDTSINKQLLMDIFKREARLQKLMDFDGFLLSLVHIAILLHEDFDPRSYMNIDLFLTGLKVKYHSEFMSRLEQLQIKYTPDQFMKCYHKILPKQAQKPVHKSLNKPNPRINTIQTLIRKDNEVPTHMMHQSILFNSNSSHGPDLLKGYESQRLPQAESATSAVVLKGPSTKLAKRKSSLPILPRIEQNRYFKPIQKSNKPNTFSVFLKKSENKGSTSVFKNRITGYSNINKLKHLNNPEALSKQALQEYLNKKINKAQDINQNQFVAPREEEELPQEQQMTAQAEPA